MKKVNAIPKAPHFDSTVHLLMDPYLFVSKICKNLNSDCFQTRILGSKTICFKGSEAATFFYNSELTKRNGAAPERVRATLFGKGAIQSLDGEAHRRRKDLFMSFMGSESIKKLSKYYEDELSEASHDWLFKKKIIFFDEMQMVLTKTACRWAGVPLLPNEAERIKTDLTSMFDSAAAIGAGHIRSRFGRKRTELWISYLVQQQRKGKEVFPTDSPADLISSFTDTKGKQLSARQSAVEIINLLRPTVAISVYAVFILHALHIHSQFRTKMIDRKERFNFIQEIRRFYPFFPSVMAITKKEFQFQGFQIPKNTKLMLDLYGTNHDEKTWEKASNFNPKRFLTENITPYNLIPQGGGSHLMNHRCPGEDPTLLLMNSTVHFFTNELNYEIPEQNFNLDFSRLPALPKSRLIIQNINLAHKLGKTRKAPTPEMQR